MNKSYLSGTVRALILFTMISSADAATIAGDDTTITSKHQLHAQMYAVSPSSLSDTALVLNPPGDSVQSRPDEKLYFSIDAASPVATHRTASHKDSHKDVWLLLLAAVIAGSLLEFFHRRSSNR